MSKPIKLSYLVPSYNHADYLLTLLESIKEDIQTLNFATEILILDDGSSDSSLQLIKDWSKKQPDTLNLSYEFQENKGISFVFNRLIERSRGEYLRICASDDVIIKGSSQLLLNEFLNQPDLLCALGDGHIINHQGEVIYSSSIEFHGASTKRLENKNHLMPELIQRWCVAGPSILIKRSHYQNMHYNEQSTIEDFDLFLSLLAIPNSISFINQPVCLYRLHDRNTSKTTDRARRIKNLRSFLLIIEKYLQHDKLSCYLLPLKYKSKAKVFYLQNHFFKASYCMLLHLFFKWKEKIA